jgi:atypical dual specificity phosphatase
MKFSEIEPGILVASSIPFSATDIYALHQQGVRALISLTERSLIGLSDITAALLQELDLTYLHAPIRDHYPPDHAQARHILQFIEQMKAEKRLTFIHCHAGVGRTGTILHAYFIGQGLSLANAKARVKARRIQCMLLSPEQEDFLSEFAQTQKKNMI